MRTLKQCWHQISARFKDTFPSRGYLSQEHECLEHGIAAPGRANEWLVKKPQQLRDKVGTARSEDSRRMAALEQLHRETEMARSVDQDKLAALEQQLCEVQTGQNQTHDQIKALETSLAETSTRLETTQRQAAALQDVLREQTRIFEASWSRTDALIQTIDNQVRALADNGRLYEQMWREMQAALHRQGLRLGWIIVVVATAIALATTSSTYLLREKQENARLLASMSNDTKHLLASLNQHLKTTHQAATEIPAAAAAEGAMARDDRSVTIQNGLIAGEMANTTDNFTSHAFQHGGTPDSTETRQQHNRITYGMQEQLFHEGEMINQDPTGGANNTHYRIITSGRGRLPDISDSVLVNFLAVSPGGKVIDDTYSSGQPVTLYMNEITPVLQKALLNMAEGAEWEVFVPEQQREAGTAPQRGMRVSGPAIYMIELVEVLEEN